MTMTAQGVEVAGAIDTAIQSWEQLGTRAGRDVAIEAVRRELVTAQAIAVRALSYPTLKRRGQFIELLDDLAGGIDSFLELHTAREVLVGPEFAGIVRHARVGPAGRTFEADFYHPGARLDVETDGKRHHNDDRRRRQDLERDAILASVGIQTIRLTYEDVMGRPQWCQRVIADAIRARSS
ncbi:endonuclease domain-containing protein, partial [Demequina sp. TTPB684]